MAKFLLENSYVKRSEEACYSDSDLYVMIIDTKPFNFYWMDQDWNKLKDEDTFDNYLFLCLTTRYPNVEIARLIIKHIPGAIERVKFPEIIKPFQFCYRNLPYENKMEIGEVLNLMIEECSDTKMRSKLLCYVLILLDSLGCEGLFDLNFDKYSDMLIEEDGDYERYARLLEVLVIDERQGKFEKILMDIVKLHKENRQFMSDLGNNLNILKPSFMSKLKNSHLDFLLLLLTCFTSRELEIYHKSQVNLWALNFLSKTKRKQELNDLMAATNYPSFWYFFVRSVSYNSLTIKALENIPPLRSYLAPNSSKSIFSKACKVLNTEIIEYFLNNKPELPAYTVSKALINVCVGRTKHRTDDVMEMKDFRNEETETRTKLFIEILNVFENIEETERQSKMWKSVKFVWTDPFLAACAFLGIEAIEAFISKHPAWYKTYKDKYYRNAGRASNAVSSTNGLEQSLLHDSDEKKSLLIFRSFSSHEGTYHSLLYMAASKEFWELSKLLILSPAKPNIIREVSYLFIKHDRVQLLEEMLLPYTKDNFNTTMAAKVALKYKKFHIFKWLCVRVNCFKINLNLLGTVPAELIPYYNIRKWGNNVLEMLVLEGNLDLVKEVIESDSTCSFKNSLKFSDQHPIYIAAALGQASIVEYFLQFIEEPTQIIVQEALKHSVIGDFSDLPRWDENPFILRAEYILKTVRDWKQNKTVTADYKTTKGILESRCEYDLEILEIACFYGYEPLISHVIDTGKSSIGFIYHVLNGLILMHYKDKPEWTIKKLTKPIIRLRKNTENIEKLLVKMMESIEEGSSNHFYMFHILHAILTYRLNFLAVPLAKIFLKSQLPIHCFSWVLASCKDKELITELLSLDVPATQAYSIPKWEHLKDFYLFKTEGKDQVLQEYLNPVQLEKPTALHWAAVLNDRKCVDLLLNCNADKSTFAYAREFGIKKVKKTLKLKPSDLAFLAGNYDLGLYLGEFTSKGMKYILYSGNIEAIRSLNSNNLFTETVKSKNLLYKACCLSYEDIALFLLEYFNAQELRAMLTADGNTNLLHVAASNNMKKFIRAVLTLVPEHKEILDAVSTYELTPYQITQCLLKQPLAELCSDRIKDTEILTSNCKCASGLLVEAEPYKAHVVLSVPTDNSPLYAGILKWTYYKDMRMILEVFKNYPNLKHLLSDHISNQIYTCCVKYNYIEGIQVLAHHGIVPMTLESILNLAGQQGRDSILLYLLDTIGKWPNAYTEPIPEYILQMPKVAVDEFPELDIPLEKMFYTGCKQCIHYILQNFPNKITVQHIENLFAYNFMEIGVTVCKNLIGQLILPMDDLKSLVSSLKGIMSEVKHRSLVIELMSTFSDFETWESFLEKYSLLKRYEARMHDSNKLYLHMATAEHLHQSLFPGETLSLPTLKQLIFRESSEGSLYENESTAVDLEENIENVYALLSLIGSTQEMEVSSPYKSSFRINNQPPDCTVDEDSVKVNAQIQKANPPTDGVFSVVKDSLTCEYFVPKLIHHSNVQAAITSYLQAICKEGEEVSFDFSEISPQYYEVLHREFQPKQTGCGVQKLLDTYRNLRAAVSEYYKINRFDHYEANEIELPRFTEEVPYFSRTVSGSLRPTKRIAQSELPPQLMPAFNKANEAFKVEAKMTDRASPISKDFEFSIGPNGIIFNVYAVEELLKLKAKVLSHEMLMVYATHLDELLHQIEFNILTLVELRNKLHTNLLTDFFTSHSVMNWTNTLLTALTYYKTITKQSKGVFIDYKIIHGMFEHDESDPLSAVLALGKTSFDYIDNYIIVTVELIIRDEGMPACKTNSLQAEEMSLLFLSGLLPESVAIEEVINKAKLTLVFEDWFNVIRKDSNLDLSMYFDWNSLFILLNYIVPDLLNPSAPLAIRSAQLKSLHILAENLEKKELWDGILAMFDHPLWDDLMILNSFVGIDPNFTLGNLKAKKFLLNALRLLHSVTDASIKRCYLMRIDFLSSGNTLSRNDKIIVLERNKPPSLLNYKSVIEGKVVFSERSIKLNKIKMAFKVFKSFPQANELKFNRGPLLLCDRSGAAWHFLQENLPTRREEEGREVLDYPPNGNLAQPIPKELTVHFNTADTTGLLLTVTPNFDVNFSMKLPFPPTHIAVLSNSVYVGIMRETNLLFKRLMKKFESDDWTLDVSLQWEFLDNIEAEIARPSLGIEICEGIRFALTRLLQAIEELWSYSRIEFDYNGYRPFCFMDFLSKEIAEFFKSDFNRIIIKFDKKADVELVDSCFYITIGCQNCTINDTEDIFVDAPYAIAMTRYLANIFSHKFIEKLEKSESPIKITKESELLNLKDLALLASCSILQLHFNQVRVVSGKESLEISLLLGADSYFSVPKIVCKESCLEIELRSSTIYRIDSVVDCARSLFEENIIPEKLVLVPTTSDSVMHSPEGKCGYFVQYPEKTETLECKVYCALTCEILPCSASIEDKNVMFESIPIDREVMIVFEQGGVPVYVKYLLTKQRLESTKDRLYLELTQSMSFKNTSAMRYTSDSVFKTKQYKYPIRIQFGSDDPEKTLEAIVKSYSLSEDSHLAAIQFLNFEGHSIYASSLENNLAIVSNSEKQASPIEVWHFMQGKKLKFESKALENYRSIENLKVTMNLPATFLSTNNSEEPPKDPDKKPSKKSWLNRLFKVSLAIPKSLHNFSRSIAGEVRRDVLHIISSLGAPTVLEPNVQVYFKHNQDIVIHPEIKELQLGKYELAWQPNIKGQYFLYINKKRIRETKPIFVKAGHPSLNSEIVLPNELFQLEPSYIIIQLKDYYGNEVTKSECTKEVLEDQNSVVFNDTITMTVTIKNLNNDQEYSFKYSLSGDHPQIESKFTSTGEIEINCTLNFEAISNTPKRAMVKPSKFETRRKIFYRQAHKLPHYNGYRNINVDRFNFIGSLMENAPDDLSHLRKRLDVKWKGEAGGGRGPTTELYDKIGKELANPDNHFFVKCKSGYKPSSLSKLFENHLYGFRIAGAFIANALIHKKLLGISFSVTVLNRMLGVTMSNSDLNEEDPELYSSIMQMLEYSAKEIEDADLNFTATTPDYKPVNLVPEGDSLKVTIENVQDYVNYLLEWHNWREIEDQLICLCEGFHAVIPINYVSMFAPNELGVLMSGSSSVTLSYIKKRARYEYYNASSKVVQWLWSWLEDSGDDILRSFLRFSTGSSSIPHKAAWHIVIAKNGNNHLMPEASTCFSTIRIPIYPTYEKLVKYMKYAVLEGNEGYAFA